LLLSWQQIPSTVITEILCNIDFDGIVIDTEHGFFNLDQLFNAIQVAKLCNKICFVRLTKVEKAQIRKCLDAGCDGLIFSMIETIEQADRVYKHTRYPEFGGSRGLGLIRQNTWGIDEKLVKSPPIVIAQIETEKGVLNLQKIYNENIFDFFMIGPYDLSSSLGIPGDFKNTKYIKCIKNIEKIVGFEKMAVHVPNNVANEVKKYANYKIKALGMDTTFIIEKYKELKNVKF